MSEKSKNILLGVLIVGLVSMTVAYAALSTSLTIGGTATVQTATWDIHFANVTEDSTTTTGVITSMGTLDNTSLPDATATGTAFSGLQVNLAKPGDKAVINFNIVNAGTIDAKKALINAFSMSITPQGGTTVPGTAYGTLTSGPVDYTISCDNEPAVLTKAGGATPTNACTLTVEYKDLGTDSTVTGKQASQTAGEDQTATVTGGTYTLAASWTYVQN